VRPGDYTVHLGGSQPGESPDEPLVGTFAIRNTQELPR
jgi:hypothetical protein